MLYTQLIELHLLGTASFKIATSDAGCLYNYAGCLYN